MVIPATFILITPTLAHTTRWGPDCNPEGNFSHQFFRPDLFCSVMSGKLFENCNIYPYYRPFLTPPATGAHLALGQVGWKKVAISD